MGVILKTLDGRDVPLEPGHMSATAECDCPACGKPLAVRGDGIRVSACSRYYYSRGFCIVCDAEVGELRAYPSTIFGIEATAKKTPSAIATRVVSHG